MADRAGAIIVPDISVTRPPSEVRSVMAHLRRMDQLNGSVGSLGPSNVTCVRNQYRVRDSGMKGGVVSDRLLCIPVFVHWV